MHELLGQRHQRVALARRHAGGGLVHQQQARAVGHRDRELDALDVAVGEHAARAGRPAPSCRPGRAAPAPRRACGRARGARRRERGRRARAAPSARSRRTVSEAKVSAIWKVRPTPRRQIVARLPADQLDAVEPDRAGVGRELAVDHVEGGRLAGAVRADQRQQFAGGEVEADAVDGPHAAEGLAEVAAPASSADSCRGCARAAALTTAPRSRIEELLQRSRRCPAGTAAPAAG